MINPSSIHIRHTHCNAPNVCLYSRQYLLHLFLPWISLGCLIWIREAIMSKGSVVECQNISKYLCSMHLVSATCLDRQFQTFWANYINSLTWIKAIWGWFPLLTMIPGFGRSEVVIKFTQIHPDETNEGEPPILLWESCRIKVSKEYLESIAGRGAWPKTK